MNIGTLRFVDTDGGPLIVLPHRVLDQWKGVYPPEDGRRIDVKWRFDSTRPATDYDRALNAPSPVGTIEVGDAVGLVLGSYMDNAAWYPLTRSAAIGAFVRVASIADKDKLLPIIDRLDFPDETVAIETWQIDDRLRLFDASARGATTAREGVDIDVPAGLYVVHTWRYEDRAIAEVVVHRLMRSEREGQRV